MGSLGGQRGLNGEVKVRGSHIRQAPPAGAVAQVEVRHDDVPCCRPGHLFPFRLNFGWFRARCRDERLKLSWKVNKWPAKEENAACAM